MRKKNNKRKANPIKRQAKVVISIMDKMYDKQRDTLAWDDEFFEEIKVCVRTRIEAAIKSVYLHKKDTLPTFLSQKAWGKRGGSWKNKQDKGSRGDLLNLNPSNLYIIAQYFMKDAMEVWNDLNEIETVS